MRWGCLLQRVVGTCCCIIETPPILFKDDPIRLANRWPLATEDIGEERIPSGRREAASRKSALKPTRQIAATDERSTMLFDRIRIKPDHHIHTPQSRTTHIRSSPLGPRPAPARPLGGGEDSGYLSGGGGRFGRLGYRNRSGYLTPTQITTRAAQISRYLHIKPTTYLSDM